jgi:hypothetical protein
LENSLHATRDRMITLLLDIGDSMERARSIGTGVQSHIQAEDMFSGGMTKALHAVRAFEVSCGWLLHHLGMEGAEADHSLLPDRYTMVSEREIHARVTAASASEAASPQRARHGAHSAAPAPAPPEDDLGDNVELF